MLTTNRLIPMGTLKRRILRNFFSKWVLQFINQGRILTLKLATEVCRQLRAKFGMPTKGDPMESKRLHWLLKTARKRQIGSKRKTSRVSKPQRSAMSSMDALQTVPLHSDELFGVEDWWGGSVEDGMRVNAACSKFPMVSL